MSGVFFIENACTENAVCSLCHTPWVWRGLYVEPQDCANPDRRHRVGIVQGCLSPSCDNSVHGASLRESYKTVPVGLPPPGPTPNHREEVNEMATYELYSNICVNPRCPGEPLPHWKEFGKPGPKCPKCGQAMRRIKGEPRGTQHTR